MQKESFLTPFCLSHSIYNPCLLDSSAYSAFELIIYKFNYFLSPVLQPFSTKWASTFTGIDKRFLNWSAFLLVSILSISSKQQPERSYKKVSQIMSLFCSIFFRHAISITIKSQSPDQELRDHTRYFWASFPTTSTLTHSDGVKTTSLSQKYFRHASLYLLFLLLKMLVSKYPCSSLSVYYNVAFSWDYPDLSAILLFQIQLFLPLFSPLFFSFIFTILSRFLFTI